MADISLKGSERAAMPGAREVAPADPAERLEVTVLVRRRAGEALHTRAAQSRSGHAERGLLDPRGIRANGMAPTRRTWRACAALPRTQGLAVVHEHAARRTVMLVGHGGAVQRRLQCSAAAHAARKLQLSRPHRRHLCCRVRSRAWSRRCWVSTAARRPRPHFRVAAGGEHGRLLHADAGRVAIRLSRRQRRWPVRGAD